MVEPFLLVLFALSLVALRLRRRKGYGISILVPFHCPDDSNQRAINWKWLKSYWHYHLPGAEIIMGEDRQSRNNPSIPFSKSVAVNNAASKASGDIYVIADADAYIAIDSVVECVDKIRKEREKGFKLWFIPYRQFYRLTQEASQLVLQSDHKNPYSFPIPPSSKDIQNMFGSGPRYGHWYGAMLQIVPREGFEEVGGWDERFRGWGGEDHAIMRATDTLYWRHKTLPGAVFHIWHPMLSPSSTDVWVDHKDRVWEGQKSSGVNDNLSGRYYGANGNKQRMHRLVDEWKLFDDCT